MATDEPVVIYFNVSNTEPGSPAGTWPADKPMPPPSVHAMGDPDAIAGIQAFIARAEAAGSRLAEAEELIHSLAETGYCSVLCAGSVANDRNACNCGFIAAYDEAQAYLRRGDG